MVTSLHYGEQLEGKYTILNKIGEGGMGVVYEAEHNELHLRVAIKVLHPLEAVDQNMITRFKVEARSAASIRHQNVVEVTDFGLTPDNRPFFVMEFVEGESLADRLDRQSMLSERETVEILDQILSGLSVAHKKGIIHRDIKPENVIIARQNGKKIVKLLDFGIAKIVGGSTLSNPIHYTTARPETEQGIVLGTPGYMAPESMTGRGKVDTRADLFSVGVIMYEMITGQRPFKGTDAHTVMLETVRKPVPRPSAVNPNISKAMEQLCLTSLAKNPDERIQTTDEFVYQLTAAAVGRIPDDVRPCNTHVGLPSVAPMAELKDIPETSELEYIHPQNTESDNRLSPRVISPPKYKGPARRRRRFILPVSPFSIVLTLAVAAASYFLFFHSDSIQVIEHEEASRIKESMDSRHQTDPTDKFDKYIKHTALNVPEIIKLWVDVKPRNATITINGKKRSHRPISISKSSVSVKIEISAKGYRTKTIEIVPNSEQTITAKLKKRRRRHKKRK